MEANVFGALNKLQLIEVNYLKLYVLEIQAVLLLRNNMWNLKE